MDLTILETAVRTAGVLPSAVEDAVRRLQQHFEAHASPSPALVAEQLTLLRETAPHLFPRLSQAPGAEGVPPGMPESVWKSMSASAKLAWARAHQPPPVVERRPQPLTLTSEQVATLAQLAPAQRLAAYRALQAQQGKG